MNNLDLLKTLYTIHSPSGGEKKIKKFIRRWVRDNVPDAIIDNDNAGNVYITRGIADTYPCVVAHCDQVQNIHDSDFEVLEAGDILIGYSAKMHRQNGLGADDKNGIWVALNCLQRYEEIKVAFFVSEEIGCVGSGQADMSFFDDCRFVLQCDRRNAHDLITNVWGQMCSEEFLLASGYEAFGYRVQHGAMTDVATLKDNGLQVSAVNISCAYYEPHTDCEFTVVSELYNCLHFVYNIIENCTDVYPHELVIESKSKWHGYDSWGYDWMTDPIQSKSTTNNNGTAETINDEWAQQWSELIDCLQYEGDGLSMYTCQSYYDSWHDVFPLLNKEDFRAAWDMVCGVDVL